MTRTSLLGASLLWLLLAGASGASAQVLGGCDAATLGDPPRSAFQCGGGLVIEAEAAQALRLVSGDASPERVSVESGAVFVEIAPRAGSFQILTPHAIASVRGTVFAVDVEEGRTSVLVLEGEVGVSRPDGSETVSLGAGEGVDVAPAEPLVVRTWGQGRVSALLARFGR